MKKELAEKLVEAADSLNVEASIFYDYSGRRMYGKTTTGIVVNNVFDVSSLGAKVVFDMNNKDNSIETQNKIEDIISDLKELRSDNLAMQYIVY